MLSRQQQQQNTNQTNPNQAPEQERELTDSRANNCIVCFISKTFCEGVFFFGKYTLTRVSSGSIKTKEKIL